MENDIHTENEAPEPAPWEGHKQYLRITREDYETARQKRLQYLLLYGFIFFLWAGMRIAEMRGHTAPSSLSVVFIACFALFYIQFVSVMRLLGFSLLWLIVLCLVLIPLIPGFLILGAVDRRTLKMLEQARKLFEATDGEIS